MQAWLLSDVILAYVIFAGACVGSFIGVVVSRLPANLSVVRPRSRCPSCERPIAWYDNIPVLSYILLWGRCRGCHTTISLRYPMIELLMAALTAGLWVKLGPSWDFVLWFPLTAALLAITFLDLDHWWVPDVITFPGMLFVGLISWFALNVSGGPLVLGLLPAALVYGVGWSFEKVTGREGLGLGDVKLLALIGLALGPLKGLYVLFFASVQGAIIGGIVTLLGGHAGKELPDGGVFDDDDWTPPPRAVPFGPFLALATLEMVLLPEFFHDGPLVWIDMIGRYLG